MTGIWPCSSSFHPEKCLALSPLYLPRQQLSMSQLFPMLHFPGCTILDLTDSLLYPCAPSSSPPPGTARCSPRATKGEKDHFHHPAGAQEQSGTWLPTGEHQCFMFTNTKPQGPPHNPFQPVPFGTGCSGRLSDLPAIC